MKYLCLGLLLSLSIAGFSQKKKSPKPDIGRADSLYNLGNYKDAVTIYQQLWKINSKQPGLRLKLARTYSMMNNNDESLAMLDSAIANGLVNHVFFDSDPPLANVRKDPRYQKIREKAMDIAYPCRQLAEAKQFDFWLGDWDVSPTATPGANSGFNRITKEQQGCVILETYHSTTGPYQGTSLNFYDPVDKKWKQKWIGSAQDSQDFYDGEYVDNYMRFKYIGRNPDGTTFNGRLTFTNIQDGKVRQHNEKTGDDGKTWSTVYDLTYIRRSEGAKP